MEFIKFGDIKEKNGKTIRENNLEKLHNIPIGSLVEIKYHKWGKDGSCQKVEARLWVVKHTRDCDGTPLYCLCLDPIHKEEGMENIYVVYRGVLSDGGDFWVKNDISINMIKNVIGGYTEDSLTVIEVTEDIKSGKDCLEWSK